MNGAATSSKVRSRALVGTLGLIFGAGVLSCAATQFVAYRLGYHAALGAPLIAHFYAPWSWLQWQQAPWASNAETTFRIVDSTLMAVATIGMLAVLCI